MRRIRIFCLSILVASTYIILGVFVIMFGTSTVYILKPDLYDNGIFKAFTGVAVILILIFSFKAFWSAFKRSYSILETPRK